MIKHSIALVFVCFIAFAVKGENYYWFDLGNMSLGSDLWCIVRKMIFTDTSRATLGNFLN